ncbi:Na+/H+ antiporter NhaC [Vibrio gallicus]|uniref:Na+/H+ antiporter NhaC n=1 Tax=Vibrio gallicus TaxID=190897 RepID=UPI0021C2C61A|nr:Na+/H+ antiporter NhaC [Vibrio gallicus]
MKEIKSSDPSFTLSLITFITIILVISIGLFYLKTSLHSLMLCCIVVASLSALTISSNGFNAIRKAMNSGLSSGFSAIYIFILIGVLIAAFIQSGTLATLIYYGVQTISPSYFLPGGLILCSLMSLATGTSWGTVGTAGVMLMGIGTAMNIPAPLIAGMVISGACFGDKMSPVSDTTNLSAMSSGTNLYVHIRSMAFTTGPAYIISLIIFAYLGLKFGSDPISQGDLNNLTSGIEQLYCVGLIPLLPLLTMLILSIKRVPAEPTMMISIIVACLIALFIQDKSFTGVLNALYSGEAHHSGIPSIDQLFGRGGITSMMWTLSLSLMALALGGILHEFGFIRVLMSGILQRIQRTASLVFVTMLSCFLGNLSMGEAYMSIILGGKLFGEAFDKFDLDRAVMSRTLEEGATLTTALIPWTTAGAFFSSTLGVQVLDYAPWALLNWINPLLSLVLAYLGIALFKKGTLTPIVTAN